MNSERRHALMRHWEAPPTAGAAGVAGAQLLRRAAQRPHSPAAAQALRRRTWLRLLERRAALAQANRWALVSLYSQRGSASAAPLMLSSLALPASAEVTLAAPSAGAPPLAALPDATLRGAAPSMPAGSSPERPSREWRTAEVCLARVQAAALPRRGRYHSAEDLTRSPPSIRFGCKHEG
jgi:hypothetical protein